MRFVFSAMRARVTHMSWPKAGISGHQTRESPALRQEARTRRFAGRAAGRSHKSARGVPEISIPTRYSADRRRFRDNVASLAGLGNRKSYRLATPLAPLRQYQTFPPLTGEGRLAPRPEPSWESVPTRQTNREAKRRDA